MRAHKGNGLLQGSNKLGPGPVARKDTHYRNQFETASSGGLLAARPMQLEGSDLAVPHRFMKGSRLEGLSGMRFLSKMCVLYSGSMSIGSVA